MKTRHTLIIFFITGFIALQFFSFNKVNSEIIQPPAGYANEPSSLGPPQTCTYCHTGVPIPDSTNFLLLIGTDTSSLSTLTSGVTTYTPNQIYFLRVQATILHTNFHRFGFELTAQDGFQNGQDIGSFTVLNSANTSLVNTGVIGSFVGHYNANLTHVWTFQWTAPATNIGPITFYWAGNDANGDSTQEGDSIYVVQKTIAGTGPLGINDISSELTDVNILPTISSNNVQLEFNLSSSNNITGQLITMNGDMAESVLNETLPAGNYRRSIDVSHLASGIYLLKLQIGDAYLVKKIIRQ